MVVLDDSASSGNNSGGTTPSPKLLIERLTRARAQQAAQTKLNDKEPKVSETTTQKVATIRKLIANGEQQASLSTLPETSTSYVRTNGYQKSNTHRASSNSSSRTHGENRRSNGNQTFFKHHASPNSSPETNGERARSNGYQKHTSHQASSRNSSEMNRHQQFFGHQVSSNYSPEMKEEQTRSNGYQKHTSHRASSRNSSEMNVSNRHQQFFGHQVSSNYSPEINEEQTRSNGYQKHTSHRASSRNSSEMNGSNRHQKIFGAGASSSYASETNREQARSNGYRKHPLHQASPSNSFEANEEYTRLSRYQKSFGQRASSSTSPETEEEDRRSNGYQNSFKHQASTSCLSDTSLQQANSNGQQQFSKPWFDKPKPKSSNFNYSVSSVTSNSTSNSSEQDLQYLNRRYNPNYGDDEEVSQQTAAGVLHLKEPLINENNATNYYDNHGRMEEIDWSIINKEKMNSGVKTKSNAGQNKAQGLTTTLRELSKKKPEAKTEMMNFAKNSEKLKTAYEVRGNVVQIKNTTESPLLKVLQKINSNTPLDAVKVSPNMKQLFEKPRSSLTLMDIIDQPVQTVPPYNHKTDNCEKINGMKSLDSLIKITENNASLTNGKIDELEEILVSPQNYNAEEYEKLNDTESLDNLAVLPKTNTNETQNKKIHILEGDSFISFVVKPSTKSDTSWYSANSTCSEISVDNDSKNTNSPSSVSSLYKKLRETRCTKKLDSTLDSDDLSLTRTSELDEIDACRRFSPSAFIKKLKLASSQCSVKQAQITDVSVTTDEQINHIVHNNNNSMSKREFLLKEVRTRYFKKSQNNVNSVELSSVKKPSNEKTLLNPISTRYFEKTSTIENHSNVIENIQADQGKVENLNNDTSIDSTSFYESCDTVESISLSTDEIFRQNCRITDELMNPNKSNSVKSDNVNISKENETFGENCKISDEQVNPNTSNSVESDNKDNSKANDYTIIFRKHETTTETSVVHQEIDMSFEENVETDGRIEIVDSSDMNGPTKIVDIIDTEDQLEIIDTSKYNTIAQPIDALLCADYDDIDPDAEFDIVGMENCDAFEELVKSLRAVQAAVALEIASNREELNNNASKNLKSLESSLEISENNYSSVSASVSSNVDTDSNPSLNSSTNNLLLNTTENIFANVKIDDNQFNASPYIYFDNTPKSSTMKEKNGKGEISSRRKKMTCALQNYQKNMKTEIEETNEETHQVGNDNFKAKESKRVQILEEIKKRNLHLSMRNSQQQEIDKAKPRVIRI